MTLWRRLSCLRYIKNTKKNTIASRGIFAEFRENNVGFRSIIAETAIFGDFCRALNHLKFQYFAVILTLPRGRRYRVITGGQIMLEILSENEEILVRTGKGESLVSQLNELRQACAATIGTIARDFGIPDDKVMGGFLLLLEEDDDWKPVFIETKEFKNREKSNEQNRS
jgi:hypothetical protein